MTISMHLKKLIESKLFKKKHFFKSLNLLYLAPIALAIKTKGIC